MTYCGADEKRSDHVPSKRVKPFKIEAQVKQSEFQEPCELQDDDVYDRLCRGQADQCQSKGTEEEAPEEQGGNCNTNRSADFVRQHFHFVGAGRLGKKATAQVCSHDIRNEQKNDTRKDSADVRPFHSVTPALFNTCFWASVNGFAQLRRYAR